MDKSNTLQLEIEKIAATIDGVCGISAVHIETGTQFLHNAQLLFPMASTCKIAIAVQCLTLVDQGLLQLESMINLQPTQIRPESGILNKRFNFPGVALSLANLIRLMLEVSDNTAADIVLNLCGGSRAVTARLEASKIASMQLNRSCLRAIAEHEGIKILPADEAIALEEFLQLENELTDSTRKIALAKFFQDPRDSCTPAAMTELLRQLQTHQLLKNGSTQFLLDCMHSCQTGTNRSPALLPPNTGIAHKTGTITGVTNDVGIITLPNNIGHFAFAVFIKQSAAETHLQERVIAQITSKLFDYFVFST